MSRFFRSVDYYRMLNKHKTWISQRYSLMYLESLNQRQHVFHIFYLIYSKNCHLQDRSVELCRVFLLVKFPESVRIFPGALKKFRILQGCSQDFVLRDFGEPNFLQNQRKFLPGNQGYFGRNPQGIELISIISNLMTKTCSLLPHVFLLKWSSETTKFDNIVSDQEIENIGFGKGTALCCHLCLCPWIFEALGQS